MSPPSTPGRRIHHDILAQRDERATGSTSVSDHRPVLRRIWAGLRRVGAPEVPQVG
jgi:hypothetical protein